MQQDNKSTIVPTNKETNFQIGNLFPIDWKFQSIKKTNNRGA